jgi:leucyl aminopeptidase
MKTELETKALAKIKSEFLVVFAADKSTAKGKDAQPEPVLLTADAVVKRAAQSVLRSGEFKAAANETLLLFKPAGTSARRLLIVGLGKASKAGVSDIRNAAGTAARIARSKDLGELAIAAPSGPQADATLLPPGPCVRAIVEGAFIADFDPDTYRSDRKDKSLDSLSVVAPPKADTAEVEAAFKEGVVLGQSQNFARALVNEPSNKLTPTIFGERVAKMAKQVGLQCEVYGAEKIRELGMGAFWSVSQGSDEAPALIVMTYEPKKGVDKNAPVLGLVGKGITFDTGGISIKPSEGMEKMKYDMAGGAAMAGAMQAIAKLKPAVKVIGIICASENMPSGHAQKPGDVQTAMSGKTIEIMNTDAEGRLVLADGISYAKQLGATHLIDAATLTGACVVALGTINAGMFTNDDATLAKFKAAAKISGEKFWELPATDDYREHIVSSIADIMNTGDSRWGGAITAAMFLKEFAEDTPWIHLDIAGCAWMDAPKPWISKGPTGIAVRSIVEWVKGYGAEAAAPAALSATTESAPAKK